jgi:hypothetical protein
MRVSVFPDHSYPLTRYQELILRIVILQTLGHVAPDWLSASVLALIVMMYAWVMEVQSRQIMMEENRVWRRLLDRYATCTRTFAEAVAGLGQYRQISADALALWEEIKRLQAKCHLVAREIDHHISRRLRSEEADGGSVVRRSGL